MRIFCDDKLIIVCIFVCVLLKDDASMDSALRAASGGFLDIDRLVKVVGQRLDIASVKSGIASIKKDVNALRGGKKICEYVHVILTRLMAN